MPSSMRRGKSSSAGHAVPETTADSREFGTTFDPFFVFSFVPDATEDDLPKGWPAEPVALHFLPSRGRVVSGPASRVHRDQACRSHPSFFVIEGTAPGRSIDLRDILTGNRFHVLEQSASRTFRPGDLTFVRVVTVGGASILLGASPWIIPPSWHVHIIDCRERLHPRKLWTRADLFEYDIEIRELYHHIVEALANPALPELRNTDGDPIEMTTLSYELGLGTAEAFDRLKPLATLHNEIHVDGETYDADGTLTGATLNWIKAGNRKNKSWDNTILGHLRLDGSRLVVEVNSAKRRDRIVREIAKRLGFGARLTETKVTDLDRALKARRATRHGAGAAEVVTTPEIERTPEIEALEADWSRKHWDAWIDTKVPALGNRTPRQAAKTARGRERLEALLSDYERSAERSRSAFVPDIAELRRILGLA